MQIHKEPVFEPLVIKLESNQEVEEIRAALAYYYNMCRCHTNYSYPTIKAILEATNAN